MWIGFKLKHDPLFRLNLVCRREIPSCHHRIYYYGWDAQHFTQGVYQRVSMPRS